MMIRNDDNAINNNNHNDSIYEKWTQQLVIKDQKI